ncbi:MAG: phosphoadenosine phosphosulfate reductase [Rhodobacteraceae bacterium]|nr:phosphoadenosine phosphosulfate reductase [Paracoccaceae bacterium]
MNESDSSGVKHAQWHDRLSVPGSSSSVELLGAGHAAIRAEEESVLLVTFERAQDILSGRPDGQPLAATLAEAAGWSRLTLVAETDSWFRDPAIYAYFDRLIDEGYFDQFDQVVFYGAGMCGYAATAYSVAAPGSTVVALAPQATLDPEWAGWDHRFQTARRLDFTSRYGFAPHMAEAAEKIVILHDPDHPLDAMHAAMFHGANVLHLRAPHLGAGIESHLMSIGLLPELIDAAGEGQLTPLAYHRLFRARRAYGPYLRGLLARLDTAERPWLAALLCRQLQARPRFAKRLQQLEARLARDGRVLPAPIGLDRA